MAKNLFKGMAALCFCAAFASCSHDAGFETPNQFELKKNEYNANFVKMYGEIDPNQSWDFTNPGTVTRGEVTSEMQQVGPNFFSYCLIDAKAIQQLVSSSSSSYNVTVDKVSYNVTATASDIDFNPYFSARITPSFARIDEMTKTTYHYYHLIFNQTIMVPNIRAVGRSGSEYWYGKLAINNSLITNTSRIINTLPGIGGQWIAYYTENTGTGTAHHNTTPVTTVREFVVNDGKNPVRTYWGFDCDGANNGKVDLICLVEEYSIPKPIAKRYMIEDLGTTNDFDFNDIVVDLKDDQLGHQTATIRAMGGMLDFTLNVNGNPVWTKSVQGAAKGYAITDMENTNPLDFTRVIDEISISGWQPDNNNISVTVVYNDGKTETGNTIYEIPFPKVGQIPMMFATDPIVPWMLEKTNFPRWWLDDQGRIDEDYLTE
jgi:hypothetical protein